MMSLADAGLPTYNDSVDYFFLKGSGYSGWRVVETFYRAGCISGRAANVNLLETAHSRTSVQEAPGSGGK